MFKVGDRVLRVKYPTMHLTPGKVYVVSEVITYSMDEASIRLEGVPGRKFDADFFALAPELEWVVGAKVRCNNPGNVLGWAAGPDVCEHGEIYTIKTLPTSGNGMYMYVEESPYIYARKNFTLVDGDATYASKPGPKTVIYNKQNI